MASYHFVTVWRLQAPIERVWDELQHPERWPAWWKGFREVRELEAGAEDGVGAVKRFGVRGALPYTLFFDGRIVRVDAPRSLELDASGELEGTGRWSLEQQGDITEARYTWDVRTSKPWMNALAPVARPFFAWNHDVVMKDGGQRLARLLGVPLVDMELSASPLRSTLNWAGAAIVSVLLLRRRALNRKA